MDAQASNQAVGDQGEDDPLAIPESRAGRCVDAPHLVVAPPGWDGFSRAALARRAAAAAAVPATRVRAVAAARTSRKCARAATSSETPGKRGSPI